jgi:hypothetical protein
VCALRIACYPFVFSLADSRHLRISLVTYIRIALVNSGPIAIGAERLCECLRLVTATLNVPTGLKLQLNFYVLEHRVIAEKLVHNVAENYALEITTFKPAQDLICIGRITIISVIAGFVFPMTGIRLFVNQLVIISSIAAI